MDFQEKIRDFSARVSSLKDSVGTEEATKTSIILPFFQLLGYDVFNPHEFVPEYTADVGTKKGEKVDYAIIVDGEPLILIEAKSVGTDLSPKHMNQLLRYFTVTRAKFAILTNGITYKFFSDLEERNKMDTVPFLEVDLTDVKPDIVEELKHFQKEAFDVKNILRNASDLKYMTMVKRAIGEQFENPSDQFVRALIGKIYPGTKTQAVLDKFRGIIQKAFAEYTNSLVSDRINAAINPGTGVPASTATHQERAEASLTIEEIEVLDHIKNMLNTDENIVYKKTSRYACMQLGDNSNRWICRVYKRRSEDLFVLHGFEGADYEREYLFNAPDQLDAISHLVRDVFKRCCEM